MNNWPVHNNPRQERAARAPYNFVPLPEQVVTVDLESLPDQDRYYPDRHTGWIDCQLVTASPIYVRAALELAEFERAQNEAAEAERDWDKQARNKPDFFYIADRERPVVPGSSLRGMLRTLVEIVGYGKAQWVTDRQRYFFRAVAAPSSDPLSRPYKDALGRVRAGYAIKHRDKWYLAPPRKIQNESFLKVRETQIPDHVLPHCLNDLKYQPAYIPVSFTTKHTPTGRLVVDHVEEPDQLPNRGVLVCTGNMLESTVKQKKPRPSPRKNHYIVPEVDPVIERTPVSKLPHIDQEAIKDYQSGLTEFQRQKPYNQQMGCLVEGRPVFYLEDPDGLVHAFGHTPNFRVPFRRIGASRASAPLDFVPTALRRQDEVDLAEAIFGYTKATGEGKTRAYAGRVFVSDAELDDGQESPWLVDEPIMPKILGSPKPTTFQHYLVQPEPNESASLRHYASDTPGQTVIRGHKLYWHKRGVTAHDIEEDEQKRKPDTQHTQIRPVKSGIRFNFTIRFENLSDAELGALIWILDKAKDDAYRLKLGMGKPYGMGSVKIASVLHLTRQEARYTHLFENETWAAGLTSSDDTPAKAVSAFEQLILGNCILNPTGTTSLDKVERIQVFLALLAWPGPEREQTRYMQIEHELSGNEYKGRPVLPGPLTVDGHGSPRQLIQRTEITREQKGRLSDLPVPAGYERGKVKDFGLGRGYNFGFIAPDRGSEDIFVHRNGFAVGTKTLMRGDVVIFRRVRGMKGFQAEDVKTWPPGGSGG